MHRYRANNTDHSLGQDAFQCTYSSPIQWAINQQNPSDPTNWIYAEKNTKYIEDLDPVHTNPDPPYGDRYLGAIIKGCASGPTKPSSKYSGVGYKVVVKDPGTLCPTLQDKDRDVCVNGYMGGPSNCSPPSNGYGLCGVDSGYHYWYVRDWSPVFGDTTTAAGCCVTPVDQTYSITGSDGNTIQAPRTLHCPPTLWAGSPLAINYMTQHCTYDDWKSPSQTYCDLFMDQNSGATTSDQQTLLVSGLESYIDTSGKTKPSENDPFTKKMADYCAQYPGLCDVYLQNVCSNVTADELRKKPQLARLCACFMPNDQYLLPGIIPIECNSMCALNQHPEINGVVRGQINQQTGIGEPIVCNQSTCVMNDVTADLINTSITGSVDFTQLCGNCPSGSCTCVFNDIALSAMNASVKGNIDFVQTCKGCSTNAGVVNCDGSSVPSYIPTSEVVNIQNEASQIQQQIANIYQKNKFYWYILLGFIILVGIGLVLFAFYYHKRKKLQQAIQLSQSGSVLQRAYPLQFTMND